MKPADDVLQMRAAAGAGKARGPMAVLEAIKTRTKSSVPVLMFWLKKSPGVANAGADRNDHEESEGS